MASEQQKIPQKIYNRSFLTLKKKITESEKQYLIIYICKQNNSLYLKGCWSDSTESLIHTSTTTHYIFIPDM